MDQCGQIGRAGPKALADAAEWLDRVHDVASFSLLSRRRWLQSWVDAFPGWEPWVLATVEDSEVRAVAPLARRRVRWGMEVVTIGDEALAESPLAACDDAAAVDLAVGLCDALHALRCPWILRLRQLPVGSALGAALNEQLPTTAVLPGVSRPVLRFADDRPPRHWLSRNTRRALAKARNRIRREGHHVDVGWVEPWSRIEEVLPELIEVHRARDLQLRGMSLLDEAQEASFYHRVIRSHAGNWRLLTVRIDESLAAYALCLQDGVTLRVWDNRVSPSWQRYSAGLIANAEVVLRAAGDNSTAAIDWGCGEQRYKLSLSNEVLDASTLIAWSSPALRAALACRNRMTRSRQRLRTRGYGLVGRR
jgi:CelD/BcsL family acetyltransferase involved in cellulose biosynthesis